MANPAAGDEDEMDVVKATAAELRRVHARQALGALSTLVPAGVIAVDADGGSWYHSQRWEDFSGHTGLSFRGRPWYEALHPDDVDVVARRWAERTERGGRLGRFRAVGADGVVRECWGEAVPMVAPRGEIDGWVIVVSDRALSGTGEATAPDTTSGAAPLAAGPSQADWPGGPRLSDVNLHLVDRVLARVSDFVTIVNPDGSWRWSSGGALRLIGHQATFDPVKGVAAIIHPDDLALALATFDQVVSGELDSVQHIEVRMRAADGTWRRMEVMLDSLLDDPMVRGVVIYARDVTNQHLALERIEASNRRLVSLVANTRAAVVLVDEDRRVVVANDAFIDLFHVPVSAADLEGHTLLEVGITVSDLIVDPPDVPARIAATLAERKPHEGRRITLYDGRTLDVDFVPVFVRGEFRGHLTSFRDVTDQARAERERERLLESEREENQRLAEIDAFRIERLATVSHELRTPLTSIVGYTHLLREVLETEGVPQELEYLDAIVRNVDRLLRLAGDLVALDSLESRTLPMQVVPVDVDEVIHRALATVEPSAAAESIALVVEVVPGPALKGDEDRLGQLFENLLTNAIKFTPSGGTVTVRAAHRRGGWVVEIADTGIGIPASDQRYLFSRFFRASNARSRGFPGTGLGLSVARAIAEVHQGSIAIESEVGAGTTVRVTMKGAKPPRA